tara:strand:+ start:2605 stop:2994 length:390 start_codon:yes stop_codon:yes gene_type:complete
MLSTTPALSSPLDMTTGHGPWSPVGYIPTVPTPPGADEVVPTGASPNVIINGRNVHNVGNVTLPHFGFLPVPPDLHSDSIATGSPTVMVNGTPMAVIGSTLGSPVGPAGMVAGQGALTVVVDSKGPVPV